jgi:hypothetical protein
MQISDKLKNKIQQLNFETTSMNLAGVHASNKKVIYFKNDI